jgi:hypothetical protein
MVLRKIMGLFVCALVIGGATLATAGIPSVDDCTAGMDNMTGGTAVLFCLPNGNGAAFDGAMDKGVNPASIVDATIFMTVLDGNLAPVPDFPSEDMWLESADANYALVPCFGGANADFTTNAAGETRWETPLRAGGSSEGDTWVMISGANLPSPLGLNFNSADIDANGVVNLLDITEFSAAFFSAYDFRCDFTPDGVLNLLDITLLSSGLGAACN